MNKIERLMNELNAKGIQLYKDGDKLRWKCVKGVLTDETKARLKKYKKKIIKRLENQGSNLVTLKPFPNRLCRGDCCEVLKHIPDNSVDLMVADPPYGLEFMGKDWDKAIPPVEIWEECFRVLKPGAFAFIMCATRLDLQWRMINNLEQAGFETGFSPIYWAYCNGMTKRQKINTTIKKRKKKQRSVVDLNPKEEEENSSVTYEVDPNATIFDGDIRSPEEKKFEGAYSGFQPKPAVEIILVVMKPLEKKHYTDQALDNDKGVTWLDDCRIPRKKGGDGRVPATILVSDDVLGDKSRYFSLDQWAEKLNLAELPPSVQKTFPYLFVPKPSTKEKDAGLDNFEKKKIEGRDSGQSKRNAPHKPRPTEKKNIHETVKPVTLMAYLITMGSREGDVVLDPFLGSGTTAVAAVGINRRIIGIEINDEYFEIAQARFRSAFLAKHYPASQVKHEEVQDDQPEDAVEDEAGMADDELKQAG